PAPLLLRLAMIIWYASWSYGAIADTEAMELFLDAPIGRGKLPWPAIVLMVLLTAVFGGLCIISSLSVILIALLAFWTVNAQAWLYFSSHLLRPVLDRQQQRHANASSFQLREAPRVLRRYQLGKWQVWRFFTGFVVIALL